MKLEKVLTYQKGKSPQKDFVSDNLILYLTPEYLRGNGEPNFISDFPNKVEVEDGDLLLLWDGSNAGEFFKGRKGFLSSTMVKFKFNEEEYHREFLFYQLKAFEGYLKAQTNGSGIPHVDRELLLGIDVERFDKSEQTRIAQILSTADRAIEQTEALIAKYQRIKTGLMQDLLTRGIDEHGRIRSEKTHRFKTEKGLRVPEEWEVTLFGQTIELVHGYQFRNFDFTIHGIPIVKISQVKPEGLDMSNCSYINENRLTEFEKQRIKNGDVLMALTGATLGKACLVQNLIGEALQNYRVGRFEPLYANDVDKTYLYFVLTTKKFLNQIFNKVNAGAQGNIGKADFEKALFVKPPFIEQLKISKTLLKITKLIEDEVQKRDKAYKIKTGLMQDLLSGRVRVSALSEAEGTVKEETLEKQ